CPFFRRSLSLAKTAGRGPDRSRISSRTEPPSLGKCTVMTTAAGKSRGKFCARYDSASTPPAEAPMATMSLLVINDLSLHSDNALVLAGFPKEMALRWAKQQAPDMIALSASRTCHGQ